MIGFEIQSPKGVHLYIPKKHEELTQNDLIVIFISKYDTFINIFYNIFNIKIYE